MCVQTIPLARDQSGQLSVTSTPFTPLHKTMTDLNLMMLAAAEAGHQVPATAPASAAQAQLLMLAPNLSHCDLLWQPCT